MSMDLNATIEEHALMVYANVKLDGTETIAASQLAQLDAAVMETALSQESVNANPTFTELLATSSDALRIALVMESAIITHSSATVSSDTVESNAMLLIACLVAQAEMELA